jgi:N-glycosyltransferase
VADLPVDRPLVLAAVGTNAQPGAARLAAVTVEALAEVECSAVVATDVDLPAPAHIRLVPHLPQTLLVPSCDLFVHHGGLNSVREAMMCGVPVVVTPFGADQPHNARRSADYGFGLVVDPATVTAEALRAACRTVLGDPAYVRRARAAQRAFLPLPDAYTAAADLVDLVSRHADGAGREVRDTYASADK